MTLTPSGGTLPVETLVKATKTDASCEYSMANPQIENGFTSIANEIMEALAKIRISGEEWQCLCVILRQTYGWQKKEDWIALSQFVDKTGMDKGNICRALNKLIAKMVIVKKDNGKGTTYCVQKNYDRWRPLSKKTRGVNYDNRGVPILTPTKDTLTKPNFFVETSDEFRLAKLLFNRIRENNPQHKPPNLQSWAKSICLMIRRENRAPDDIEHVIDWCQQDDFWKSNILSTVKLRKQFDQLSMKMKKGNGNTGGKDARDF